MKKITTFFIGIISIIIVATGFSACVDVSDLDKPLSWAGGNDSLGLAKPSSVPSNAPESPAPVKTNEKVVTPEKITTPKPTQATKPVKTEEPEQLPEETPEVKEVMAQESSSSKDVEITTIGNIELPEYVINPRPSQFGSAYDSSGNLSTKSMNWYFGKNKEHQPPTCQRDFDILEFDAYYLGDIEDKVIYLTFDEGYENGYTGQILDVLKEKNVKAAFFVTKPYINGSLDLVKRMVDEGHIVANHSVNHKPSSTLSESELDYEIKETEVFFREKTGSEIGKFFRPPAGEYSAKALDIIKKNGYKTVFWSLAFADWDVDNQPGANKSYNETVNYVHNGCIALLHAVSESNTKALPYIIDTLLENGFRFGSLDEL